MVHAVTVFVPPPARACILAEILRQRGNSVVTNNLALGVRACGGDHAAMKLAASRRHASAGRLGLLLRITTRLRGRARGRESAAAPVVRACSYRLHSRLALLRRGRISLVGSRRYGSGNRRKARIVRRAARSHARFMARTRKPKINKTDPFWSTTRSAEHRDPTIGLKRVGPLSNSAWVGSGET